MKKIFFIAVAMLLSLVACDNETETSVPSNIETKVSATIDGCTLSRAVGTSWTPGDKIGITACVGSGKPHVNMEYTTSDGNSSFTGNKIYYYNGMVLNAYYPFTDTEGTLPGNGGVITSNTRIGNQQETTQPKIDFLWDTQTGVTVKDPNVNFTFAHKMSKITFAFKETTQTKVTDIEGYEIIGLKHDGEFDTNTGICAPISDAAPENLLIKVQRGSLQNGKETAPLIFFPQTASTDQVQLRLYLNEIEGNTNPDYVQKYTCSLKFDGGELEAGHHYKFSVNISKAGLNIGNVSIEDWNEEETVDDTATLDGTPFKEDEEEI